MSTAEQESPELPTEFTQTIESLTDLYVTRFLANLDRARSLLNVHGAMAQAGPEVGQDSRDDILRAAVVFMHASLEELMRELAINLLPHASETALNDIALAGLGSGRAEKFFLGKLKQHDKKSVRELIEESVREHYRSSNFGNVREISTLLRALDLESDGVTNQYPLLAAMMDRRHQIVHRADNIASGTGYEKRSIDAEQVGAWQEGLKTFLVAIAGKAIGSHLLKKGAIERRPDGLLDIRGLPGHYK